MPPEEEKHWYCVHTKPKCEHLVAAKLRQYEGVEAYCPRLRFQRSTPRGKVWFVEALFPSYLFARFAYADSVRAVRHAHDVIRVVEFGGNPAPISDETIELLRGEMQGLDVREVQMGLSVGDSVEVSEGPMRGLKGIVESLANGADRVRVLLEFLGRQSLVEVASGKVLSDRAARDVISRS